MIWLGASRSTLMRRTGRWYRRGSGSYSSEMARVDRVIPWPAGGCGRQSCRDRADLIPLGVPYPACPSCWPCSAATSAASPIWCSLISFRPMWPAAALFPGRPGVHGATRAIGPPCPPPGSGRRRGHITQGRLRAGCCTALTRAPPCPARHSPPAGDVAGLRAPGRRAPDTPGPGPGRRSRGGCTTGTCTFCHQHQRQPEGARPERRTRHEGEAGQTARKTRRHQNLRRQGLCRRPPSRSPSSLTGSSGPTIPA